MAAHREDRSQVVSRKPIPVCDLHADTPFKIACGRTLEDRKCDINIESLKKGGLGIQVFACFTPSAYRHGSFLEFTLRMIEKIKGEIGRFPEDLVLCLRSEEIEDALASGKTAVVLAVEGGSVLEEDLGNIELLYQQGVRILTLVHSASLSWAGSSNDPEYKGPGLSPFGIDVVKEMNRLGMIIDLSHAHDSTCFRVLEQTEGPVIASHSCARELCPIPRNLSREAARGIAETGGCVGVNFFPPFLDYSYYSAMTGRVGNLFTEIDRIIQEHGGDLRRLDLELEKFDARFREMMEGLQVGAERIFDHINYFAETIGTDHVCLGSDFDGAAVFPPGMEGAQDLGKIEAGLSERGYSGEDQEKILYKNFLRAFSQAETINR